MNSEEGEGGGGIDRSLYTSTAISRPARLFRASLREAVTSDFRRLELDESVKCREIETVV